MCIIRGIGYISTIMALFDYLDDNVFGLEMMFVVVERRFVDLGRYHRVHRSDNGGSKQQVEAVG